jgi:hypothetical protein
LLGDVNFKLATEGYRGHIFIEGLGDTPAMSQWQQRRLQPISKLFAHS